MANFDAARGVAAMAPEKRSSGKSGGFWNYLRWKDGETKYIMFLTPASQLTTVQLHQWIEVGKTKAGKPRYAFFIDRRDPCIGEDYDDLTDRLEVDSARRTLGVAIELEPTYVKTNNRNKVSGFEVKLESYTRTNEDGDEVEVQAPVMGCVNQARGNFYNWLASYDESHEAIEKVAFEVKRTSTTGNAKDTTYIMVGFDNIPVDYSNLIDNIGNVGAIDIKDREGIIEEIGKLSDDHEKALAIGDVYVNRLLEDLADGDKYTELVGPIEYIEDKWGNRQAKKDGVAKAAPAADTNASKDESKIDRLRREFATKNK